MHSINPLKNAFIHLPTNLQQISIGVHIKKSRHYPSFSKQNLQHWEKVSIIDFIIVTTTAQLEVKHFPIYSQHMLIDL